MHSTLVKRSYFLQLLSSSLLSIILVNPAFTVFASDAPSISAQKTMTVSAVVVPAQVSQLGFLISALAKEVPVKEGDPVTAGQTLVVLDTPELEFAVIEAQAALHSAQAYADLQKYRRVENRRNGKIFYDVIPAEYRQRADVKVQQAQVMLEVAQINLAEGTLIAPHDGIVASISVIPGEFVQSDQAVVTLATLSALQVETTDLSELDIPKVRIGAPVSVFIEALNETVNGQVVSISPIADTVGGDVVFKATIALAEQPRGLLWGMTAEVTFKD